MDILGPDRKEDSICSYPALASSGVAFNFKVQLAEPGDKVDDATVPLPEGRAWKIDDHRQRELVAVHEGTSSRLSILTTQEEDAILGYGQDGV